MIQPGIEQGQIELKKYLDSIPLNDEETHCAVVSDFDQNNNLILIVAAFKTRTFSRKIAVFTASDLINLINKIK